MRLSKGVTLVELLIVIVVMGIISGFALVAVGKILVNTRLGIDEQTVGTLNTATGYYNFYQGEEAVFAAGLTDAEKLTLLYDKGYVDQKIEPQSKDAAFIWDAEALTWRLSISGSTVALSPYGDTIYEIAPSIMDDMLEYYTNNNDKWAKDWGDRQYTDLGLDPDDWDDPILHIYYTPSGDKLKIEPEDGYSFTVYNSEGEEFYMDSSYSWNIYFYAVDGNWYFHTIDPENIIDISTLVVELS